MTRKFVTLHDEAWLKKNCICRPNPIIHDYECVPKVYKDVFSGSAILLADNERENGMYRSLVSKTIEVTQNSDEPVMTNYGFRCIEGAPYSIPTWLVKAYWEVSE